MFKKLDELHSLLKQFKASIKTPKMEGVKPIKTSAPKLPGLPAASKKDPVAMAQQIENADMKAIAMPAAKQKKETLSTSKSGQWSLGKTTDPVTTMSTATTIEKSGVTTKTGYKFKHAVTSDGNSAYHVMHDNNHVGTLSVAHDKGTVYGQLHPSHEPHRDYLSGATKAFHIARNTKTDN